ncbi:MAG: hypothetical protein LBP20_09245 [Treponema sp.]|jgi:hypothetical protein|nr:hypothetical protein [Treponema sp.]
MNGSGKDGNNRGKNFKHGEKDTESRHGPIHERGHPGFEKSAESGKAGNSGGRRDLNEAGRDPAGVSPRKWSGVTQDNRRHDKRAPFFERPKWTAPHPSTEPIPHPLCPCCGKPIKDMSTAIADKDSGEPSHFECVAARIAGRETLESGDAVVYIGGGRFGIVHFPGMIRDNSWSRKNSDDYDTRGFQIKKIVEWENKENRAPWRKNIEEHFSVI